MLDVYMSVICKRINNKNRFWGTSFWHSRLAFPPLDSQQKKKNNNKMILGHIVLAFQIGVPTGGFSVKGGIGRKSWEEELGDWRSHSRIHNKKKNNNGPVFKVMVFQQQEANL